MADEVWSLDGRFTTWHRSATERELDATARAATAERALSELRDAVRTYAVEPTSGNLRRLVELARPR